MLKKKMGRYNVLEKVEFMDLMYWNTSHLSQLSGADVTTMFYLLLLTLIWDT